MQSLRFPVAVAVTSLALVAILIGAGGLLVGNALAVGPFGSGGPGAPWAAGHSGWQTNALPPELSGLTDIPAGQRFDHLRGVRVQLTDKDNKPLTVDVTPGTVTAASPTSLTITANDGTPHTYALDDKTIVHTKTANRHDTAPTPALTQNDKVVVATLNNASTATAVMAFNPEGFGPRGPFGR